MIDSRNGQKWPSVPGAAGALKIAGKGKEKRKMYKICFRYIGGYEVFYLRFSNKEKAEKYAKEMKNAEKLKRLQSGKNNFHPVTLQAWAVQSASRQKVAERFKNPSPQGKEEKVRK